MNCICCIKTTVSTRILMNSANSSLYVRECTQYVVYRLLYTVHCILWTVYSTVCTVKIVTACHTFLLPVSYTKYDILYYVDCGLFKYCKLYTVHFRPDSVHVLCTVYCLHKKPLNTPR